MRPSSEQKRLIRNVTAPSVGIYVHSVMMKDDITHHNVKCFIVPLRAILSGCKTTVQYSYYTASFAFEDAKAYLFSIKPLLHCWAYANDPSSSFNQFEPLSRMFGCIALFALMVRRKEYVSEVEDDVRPLLLISELSIAYEDYYYTSACDHITV